MPTSPTRPRDRPDHRRLERHRPRDRRRAGRPRRPAGPRGPRASESLEETADEARAAGAAAVVVCPADVTDEDAVRAAVDAAVERFGRLDAVVHAAQVMAYGTIEEVPREVFETVVETAVHGTAIVARVVLPVFRQQGAGHLVVVNSLLGQVAAAADGQLHRREVGAARASSGCCSRRPATCPASPSRPSSPAGSTPRSTSRRASWTGSTGRPPPPVYSPQRVARTVVATLDRPRRDRAGGAVQPADHRRRSGCVPGVFDYLVGPLLQRLAIADDDVPPTEGNVFESKPAGNATEGRWRSI